MPQEYLNPNQPNQPRQTYERGIFGQNPNLEARIVLDHEELIRQTEACRQLNLEIVMTSGSFDLVHIGHARYLEAAKKYGDILVVGVDSDEKVRQRKGLDRPVVPEEERLAMLANLRSVDLLTLKYPEEPKWELIKRIKPDTLIVTEETYNEKTLTELAEICGRVIVLEPQATTSTSAKIRRLQIEWTNSITNPIEQVLDENDSPEPLRLAIRAILNHRHDKQR